MKKKKLKYILAGFFILAVLFSSGQNTTNTDTLRLLLIGNSFSQNAARHLPQIAKEAGRPLVIGRAEIGGCSFKKHWDLAELAETKPDDPAGKAYKGKSLQMILSEGKWDIVTIQQYSMHSTDSTTYMPYARKLYNLVKTMQPEARVVVHQTWAYRSDSKDFSQITKGQYCKNEKEMWEKSREAYHRVASELGIGVIPVGDAFWKVSSSKKWKFKPDPEFDYSNPAYPDLPKQANSLHVGYSWNNDKQFKFDSHHASESGCFLGALVWYSFLFGESPTKVEYVPKGVSPDFAVYLKKVARKVTR